MTGRTNRKFVRLLRALNRFMTILQQNLETQNNEKAITYRSCRRRHIGGRLQQFEKADVDDENVAVKTTGDSISMYLGTLYGAQMVQMADSTLDKTEFIDGMKTALNTASMDSLQKMGMALSQQAQAATGTEKDKLQSRLGGMGMAAQYMLPAIEGMKVQFKIELNKAVLLKYFKEAMTADKPVDTKAAEEALDKIMNRFSPMPGNNAVDTKAAEENAKAGAAYIEKEMKADKSLKRQQAGWSTK